MTALDGKAGEGEAHDRLAGQPLAQPRAQQRAADRADAEAAEQDAVGQRPAARRGRAPPAAEAPGWRLAERPKTKPRSITLPMLGDIAT